MEGQIKSYTIIKNEITVVTIFAYATKGIPGLEISGLGKYSKNLKEKIIYITRMRRLKIPCFRYVICIDQSKFDNQLSYEITRWLEYPVLLLYWHLAKQIPIRKLDDCICAGELNVSGSIIHSAEENKLQLKLEEIYTEQELSKLKHIGGPETNTKLWNISSSKLLEHIPDLKFI